MKFSCPYCAKELDFMEMSHESDLHAIIQMQPAFGKQAHLVWAYLELFGISPLRAKAKKLRVLLAEMKRLFDSESFTHGQTTHRISQAGIAEALNLLVHRHWTDRLDNHNYLKKVMIGIAEKEGRESGKQAERDLRQKEDGLRAGVKGVCPDFPAGKMGLSPFTPPFPPADAPPPALTPERIEENRRWVQGIIKQMGGKK